MTIMMGNMAAAGQASVGAEPVLRAYMSTHKREAEWTNWELPGLLEPQNSPVPQVTHLSTPF